MDLEDLRTWRTAVEDALGSAMAGFEGRFGYPPGENLVEDPDDIDATRLAAIGPSIPGDLLHLFATVGCVSLPDIGNGIFVHRPGLVADAYISYKLRHITGRHDADVIVFGSDGGGNLYALASPAGSPVYRLPEGRVIDGVYESGSSRFEVVATDLAGFLTRVRESVERFAATGEILEL